MQYPLDCCHVLNSGVFFFFVLEGRTVVVGVLDCQMLKTWTGRAEVGNGAAFKGSSGGNCID